MTPEFTGTGDPAKSLALLWRNASAPAAGAASTPAKRGRKSSLTVDQIVESGVAIADREGLAALSMRRVAEELGVGTMSLYTHVPGKAELLDVMFDTVQAEVEGPRGVPGGWRAKLEHIARENRALHLRHPWVLQVAATRPPLGPGTSGKYEAELHAVEGTGLPDVEKDAVLTLVLGFVAGAVRGAVESVQLEQQTGMTDAQWWAAHAPILARVMDGERYPLSARIGAAAGEAHQAASDPGHAFEFGLARVLDGIEAYVAAHAAQAGEG